MDTISANQDWAVLPYNSKIIDGHYLVSNILGSWCFLTKDEFKQYQQFNFTKKDALFSKLLDHGLIMDQINTPKLIADYRKLNANLFSDTGLHIAVVTTRCNIACKYCHADTDTPLDMSFEVAAQIINYLFAVRSQNVTLEIQGGEPLLNWDTIKFLVENTRKHNLTNKNIYISMVTNGILLKEDKIDFLLDNNVGICISLDGPEDLHNSNRVFNKGQGSYDLVKEGIKRLQKAYKARNIKMPVSLISTFTKQNLPFVKEVIDELVRWGANQIAIRSVNKIGSADDNWKDTGATPEEFCKAWADGLDYILALNKKGINIQERVSCVLLTKILKKQDPGYVNLMNPSGAGRSVLAYDPKGDVYPMDEARMLEDEIFKLGNVLENKYEETMKSDNLYSICQSSLMELWSYNDVYAPWLGTDPVLNYKLQNTIVPKITQTPLHKIQHFQFDYLFEKLLNDKEAKKIFEKWVK